LKPFDVLPEFRIFVKCGVRGHHTPFEAGPAGYFPHGAGRVDRRDAAVDAKIVFNLLCHDMMVDLRCSVRTTTVKPDKVDNRKIFLIERKAV
jgi:hypothetical protein